MGELKSLHEGDKEHKDNHRDHEMDFFGDDKEVDYSYGINFINDNYDLESLRASDGGSMQETLVETLVETHEHIFPHQSEIPGAKMAFVEFSEALSEDTQKNDVEEEITETLDEMAIDDVGTKEENWEEHDLNFLFKDQASIIETHKEYSYVN